MICKQRLPGIIITFIFIPGLIFTQSFTSTNDTAYCIWMNDESLDEEILECNEQMEESVHCADVYILNSAGIMEFYRPYSFDDNNKSNDLHKLHQLPSVLHNFNFGNVTCVLDMKHHLSCFWSIANLPKNTTFFASVHNCEYQQHLNCSHIVGKKVHECHNQIDLSKTKHVMVKINISLPNIWYIIVKTFDSHHIEKLDSPHNIMVSKHLKNLEINWTLPEGERISSNPDCYTYEIKINDEVISLADGQLSYTKQDVDLTRKYAVQLRVKTSNECSDSIHWSDWSSIYEVGPYEEVNSVNPWVIMAISFLIPMLLLAVLLLCKCQRLTKKLFPPIPSPSVNVKALLEKELYCQDFSSRCVEHDTELVLTVEEKNA